jgi:predicted RNA binding protein YcfA (HicA-like mRNA interferase family)
MVSDQNRLISTQISIQFLYMEVCVVKSREVIIRGFELRGVKGRHHQFRHADGRLVTVTHPTKDIPIGTLSNIFRVAGWERKSSE